MPYIRTYKECDKEQLRYICKETAWDSYKSDPEKLECVPIIYNDYFTENEPEYIFVLADDDDTPIGYIICSVDYEKFRRLMATTYTQRVKEHRPEETAMIKRLLDALQAVEDRPVHYHIDLLPKAQRQGWGRKMIDMLCDKLKADGYTSLTAIGISRSSDGYKMYMKCGFAEIYDYGDDVVSINRKFEK